MQQIFFPVLGSLVALDALLRLRDFRAHYTEAGVLPLAEARKCFPPEKLSLSYLTPAAWWQGAVLVLMAASGVALAYGLPGAAVAAWALTGSVQNRNPRINNGGDHWLVALLFWSIWYPSAAGRFALVAQTALVYWMTVARRTSPEWHTTGIALERSLSLRSFQRPFGRLLLERFPRLLRPLTFATMWVEALAPWCLLMPWPAPIVGVAALGALQVGIWLSMSVGLFQAISIVAMLPALDPTPLPPLSWWDAPCLLLFIYTAAFCAPGMKIPERHRKLGRWLRLNQVWDMFSPRPYANETKAVLAAKNVRWRKWYLS